MAIFMMFGKYTSEAIKGISTERTKKAINIIEENGGKVINMYAMVGEHDLVFILNLPDVEKAITVSVALKELTGISFTTSPVVEIEKFDELVAEV